MLLKQILNLINCIGFFNFRNSLMKQRANLVNAMRLLNVFGVFLFGKIFMLVMKQGCNNIVWGISNGPHACDAPRLVKFILFLVACI